MHRLMMYHGLKLFPHLGALFLHVLKYRIEKVKELRFVSRAVDNCIGIGLQLEGPAV